MSKPRMIVGSLVAVAAGLIACLVLMRSHLIQILGAEGYGQLWQLAIASIVGGVVSAAFTEMKREQDASGVRREYVKSFHATSLTSYNRAKKVRRLIRAHVLESRGLGTVVRVPEWTVQMVELEDVQLQFESLKRQVRLSPDVFGTEPDLVSNLKKMEEYLRETLTEYEAWDKSKHQTEPLSSLRQLEQFVRYERPEPFSDRFSDVYDEVEASFIRLLTH